MHDTKTVILIPVSWHNDKKQEKSLHLYYSHCAKFVIVRIVAQQDSEFDVQVTRDFHERVFERSLILSCSVIIGIFILSFLNCSLLQKGCVRPRQETGSYILSHFFYSVLSSVHWSIACSRLALFLVAISSWGACCMNNKGYMSRMDAQFSFSSLAFLGYKIYIYCCIGMTCLPCRRYNEVQCPIWNFNFLSRKCCNQQFLDCIFVTT